MAETSHRVDVPAVLSVVEQVAGDETWNEDWPIADPFTQLGVTRHHDLGADSDYVGKGIEFRHQIDRSERHSVQPARQIHFGHVYRTNIDVVVLRQHRTRVFHDQLE